MWQDQAHNIIKQRAFVHLGFKNTTTCGMSQLVHIHTETALPTASHGYIFEAHMKEHTLLNFVMLLLHMRDILEVSQKPMF